MKSFLVQYPNSFIFRNAPSSNERLRLFAIESFLSLFSSNTVMILNCISLFHVFRFCQQAHLSTPIHFSPSHPVEEVGRVVMATLLKHCDFVPLAINLVEQHAVSAASEGSTQLSTSSSTTGTSWLPSQLVEVCKIVHQIKMALIQVRDLLRFLCLALACFVTFAVLLFASSAFISELDMVHMTSQWFSPVQQHSADVYIN